MVRTQASGFAGKSNSFLGDSIWVFIRTFAFLIPCAMVGNKLLQGNIWGMPNAKGEGIVPIKAIIGTPTDKYIDNYLDNSIDTSGFVDDESPLLTEEEHRKAAAASTGARRY